MTQISHPNDEEKARFSDSAGESKHGSPLVAGSPGTRSTSTTNSPLFPDGGLEAWVQCAGSFFLFFNGFGMINTFGGLRIYIMILPRGTANLPQGVFQSYYEQESLRTESSTRISWIGSLQACLLIGVGAFTGPLFDLGYLRPLLICGTFALVFGMMMTSLCTQYWHFVLAQGLVVGLGCGLHFVPAIAVLPTYFSRKRALALGIGASGSSVGGMIYPIIFHRLQPRIGFGWTVRIMAFIMLATLCVPMIGMKMRLKPPVRRRLVDLAAWKELPYAIFGVAVFFGYMGVYIPFFYIQLFAVEKMVVDGYFTVYLLVLLNAGSFFGRLIPNYIADKVGPMNVLATCCLVTAILGFNWIEVDSEGGIITFSLLYGFFSGTLVSLPPTVAVSLSPSLSVIGVRMGMLFVPIAVGLLIGNPIAGALLRNGWTDLQAFGGATVALSGICVIGARVAKAGLSPNIKA